MAGEETCGFLRQKGWGARCPATADFHVADFGVPDGPLRTLVVSWGSQSPLAALPPGVFASPRGGAVSCGPAPWGCIGCPDACPCSAPAAASPPRPRPVRTPPSDALIARCVLTSPEQRLSFPGHSKDRRASAYGAGANSMTIVFSKHRTPFLTSIMLSGHSENSWQ